MFGRAMRKRQGQVDFQNGREDYEFGFGLWLRLLSDPGDHV